MCPGRRHRGAENHASSGHRIVTGALCTAPGALCTLHCTNPLEMPLTQSKCIPAEQTSKYQERETGALLKLLILVRASRSQSSRIKSYQMHFPSSVNGSLLTPSFLRGDCPKAHAITEQPLRSHVRYCGFHNSCKQARATNLSPLAAFHLPPQSHLLRPNSSACSMPPSPAQCLL